MDGGDRQMIFITLGSQKFQFNRLLKAVDKLVANGTITDNVVAQIGYSDYKPQNFGYENFFDREMFAKIMDEAETVITHGGTGAIVGAVKKGKKVIAVPRLSKYGEHVDDHQLQLIEQFKNLNLICGCTDIECLGEALETVDKTQYKSYQGNAERIIENIESFIENIR